MVDAHGVNYPALGTTPPIRIPKGQTQKLVKRGKSYFVVKIHAAQAAFTGSFWEHVRQLVVTSGINLTRDDNEKIKSIQRSRRVNKGKAEQLGLATDLLYLTPATMDHVTVNIDFLLDVENRLASLAGLINGDAFAKAFSFAPTVAAVAKNFSGLAQNIITTFLGESGQQPILQFLGDFNIDETADEGLSEAYYVILGSRDEHYPLPKPLPQLTVQGDQLLANGQPVTQWSYIILDVTVSDARTRALGRGELWYKKLIEVETETRKVSNNPLATQEERNKSWKDYCMPRLTEADTLLQDDPLYLPDEAKEIIKQAYAETLEKLKPVVSRSMKVHMLSLMGVDSQAALLESAKAYEASVKRAQPTLKALGLLPQS